MQIFLLLLCIKIIGEILYIPYALWLLFIKSTVSETALMLRLGNNGKKKMRDFVIISCKVFTVTEKYDIAYILVNYQYILES